MSVARPYSQWSPGWKFKGSSASRVSMSPTVSPGLVCADMSMNSGCVIPR